MGILDYRRMPIEIEAPEQFGYDKIKCNLAESSVYDFNFSDIDFDLKDLKLAYCDHLGKQELRESLISNCNNLIANQVLITNGAAGGLFIVSTSLLDKQDHLIVVSPNYANNIETPELIGCKITKIPLKVEQNFKLDINSIECAIKSNTKLISLTTPHNPTGGVLSKEEITQLIQLANKHNVYLLFDETYKGLTEGDDLPFLADLSDKIITVSSLSKAYGLPGIRIGWLMSQDETLNEKFLAAKEQIHLTNSILDEEVAYQFLRQKEYFLDKIKKHVLDNFQLVEDWINENKYISWVKPSGGVVCFPWLSKEVDISKFYNILNNDLGTWVGPGHWFNMDDRFFRLGYGWPNKEELIKGLENIDNAIKQSI